MGAKSQMWSFGRSPIMKEEMQQTRYFVQVKGLTYLFFFVVGACIIDPLS